MRYYRIALPLLLATLGSLAAFGEPQVFDDREIARTFARKLGEMADRGVPMQQTAARDALDATAGKRVAIPEPAAPASASTPMDIYPNCLPATLFVGSVYDCGKCDLWHMGGVASGWIASECGIIVTNHHVLHKDDDTHVVGVMTPDGEVYPIIEVLGGDAASDIAVARIDTGGKPLPYLRLASEWTVGEHVGVISNPRRRFFSYTSGIISRFQQTRASGGERPVYMTITADYAVGSSGGPVINTRGEVVGMVSRTSTVTAGGGDRNAGEDAQRSTGSVQMVFKDSCSPQMLNQLIEYVAVAKEQPVECGDADVPE